MKTNQVTGQRMRCTRQHIVTNTFFQMPKFLLYDEFAKLSNDARVLYSIMRNRHELSVKNGWHDENGDVFIYFKREDMQSMLRLSANTVTKVVKELKAFALMEETKQGINKPNKIYLLVPIVENGNENEVVIDICDSGHANIATPEMQSNEPGPPEISEETATLHGIGASSSEPETQENPWTPQICESGPAKFATQDPQILNPNYKEYKDNDVDITVIPSCHVSHSKQLTRQDRQDRASPCVESLIEDHTRLIKSNIGYDDGEYDESDIALVDEFIAIINDVFFTEGVTVRVGKENKSRAVVKNILLKLNCWDIEHALRQFESVRTRIVNKKQYILTLLYNCKLECEAHYTNKASQNHSQKRKGIPICQEETDVAAHQQMCM